MNAALEFRDNLPQRLTQPKRQPQTLPPGLDDLQAEFHRRIAPYLLNQQQGQVMGVFRDVMTERLARAALKGKVK